MTGTQSLVVIISWWRRRPIRAPLAHLDLVTSVLARVLPSDTSRRITPERGLRWLSYAQRPRPDVSWGVILREIHGTRGGT